MEIDVGPGTVHIAASRVEGDVESRIDAYLAGEQVTFDHSVDLSDYSPFMREVLDAVQDIPYGEIQTYGAIAEAMGRPGAGQAVAQACGQNPVPIVIPCHRVVAADGLGGYKHGEDVKEALLELEDADI